jgi:hypothetical protein
MYEGGRMDGRESLRGRVYIEPGEHVKERRRGHASDPFSLSVFGVWRVGIILCSMCTHLKTRKVSKKRGD